MLLDAHFIAAVNLIVYAGAILVLFLFVIMLLNLGRPRRRTCGGRCIAGLGLRSRGACSVCSVVMLGGGHATSMAGGMGQATSMRCCDTRGGRVVAEPMFRSYLVPFEITSLLLLVAIVGAIVLARRTRTVSSEWISRTYTLILSALLFAIGTAGVLLRRNAIIMFMCIELMLNAVNLTLVVFSRSLGIEAQVFVFFVMAVAAAEAAVGLAIIIAIFRHYELVDVDRFNLLKW